MGIWIVPYSYICPRQKTGADLTKPPTVASLCKFIALIVLIYCTMDLVLLKSTTKNYLTCIIFEIMPEITQWLLYKRRKKILKIENKRILLQTSSLNFQKKTNFIKFTLLTVKWTKISIIDGSTWKIFAFYQPHPLSIFSDFRIFLY